MSRSRTVVAALLVAATLAVALSAPAGATVPLREARLTGAAEVPDPGDGNGRGDFAWSVDGNRLCYVLSVARIGSAAAAHIHRGRVGVAGAVKVELETPAPSSAACVTLAAGLADRLRENPRRFYVNVHTAAFPGGAVRGQLSR